MSRPPSSNVQLCTPPSSLSNTLGHLSGVEGHSPVARRTGHKPGQAVGGRMLFRKAEALGRRVSLAPWTSHTVGRTVARGGALKRPSLAPHLRQHQSTATGRPAQASNTLVVLSWGWFGLPGVIAASGGILGCHKSGRGMSLASSGYRPGMLLNIL